MAKEEKVWYCMDEKRKKDVFRWGAYLLFMLILCVGSFFLGTKAAYPERETPKTEDAPAEISAAPCNQNPQLEILVDVDENAGFTTIPLDRLGGNFENEITYWNLSNVDVRVDGEIFSLEEAVREGKTAIEQICAKARMDARNGICKETSTTQHGLTHFTYRYPNFYLETAYDIYETPDGKQHLIRDFGIYHAGTYDAGTAYTYQDEQGNPIDMEDWGLAWEVVGGTPTSLTLRCTQSGGQQIGNLVTDFYTIYAGENYGFVPTREGIQSADQYEPKLNIQANAVTELTIDWTDTYGALAPGSYAMKLRITDVYDPGQVHPLMENFYDRQSYWISFAVA